MCDGPFLPVLSIYSHEAPLTLFLLYFGHQTQMCHARRHLVHQLLHLRPRFPHIGCAFLARISRAQEILIRQAPRRVQESIPDRPDIIRRHKLIIVLVFVPPVPKITEDFIKLSQLFVV